jgi:gamma-glutamyltranspeptidase/glutathione hydrolase
VLTRDGQFAGAFGSAGGNAILAYVAKTMVAAIDWNLPVQQAVAAPNLVARGASFQGEDSGVHAVMIRDGRVDGGYDPRREGVVLTLPR